MSRIFLVIASIAFLSWHSAWAGPGHDHGAAAPTGPAAETPRIESASADFELVATAEGHTLTIYLDHPDSNEPISDAQIEVSGDGIANATAKQLAAGTYALDADWLDTPGTKGLLFTITANDTVDLLNGTLTVSEPKDEAGKIQAPLFDVLARRDVLGVILGAVTLGFLIALAFRSRRVRTFDASGAEQQNDLKTLNRLSLRDAAEVIVVVCAIGAAVTTSAFAGPGHDHGDGGHDAAPVAASGNVPRKLPDGTVFVPKPTQRLLQIRTRPSVIEETTVSRELVGTVVPDPSAFGQVQAPMDGKIELNERGISYAGQQVAAGEVLALLTPTIPVADLGTMQQLRAEVEGKLIIAEQKLARLTRISDVIAQRDIEDTKAEVNALLEQKRVLAPKGVEMIKLTAPVGGIISVANVRAGQVVSARDTLFEIVDPTRLWIEGISSNVHSEAEIKDAVARDAEGHTIKLSYVGRSPTLRQQSQPFLFRLEEPHAGLTIGAPVKIFIQTKDSQKGYLVPDAAVVRGENGLTQVWVKVSPERFRAAHVRTLALDGNQTLAIAGLQAGERVVIGGAELINQIR